jgi:hypothetical protein
MLGRVMTVHVEPELDHAICRHVKQTDELAATLARRLLRAELTLPPHDPKAPKYLQHLL